MTTRTKEQVDVADFLQRVPDEERGVLIVACKDWDEIASVIAQIGALTGAVKGNPEILGPIWRTFTEQVYVMGYHRGKRESNKKGELVFVVGKPEKVEPSQPAPSVSKS